MERAKRIRPTSEWRARREAQGRGRHAAPSSAVGLAAVRDCDGCHAPRRPRTFSHV